MIESNNADDCDICHDRLVQQVRQCFENGREYGWNKQWRDGAFRQLQEQLVLQREISISEIDGSDFEEIIFYSNQEEEAREESVEAAEATPAVSVFSHNLLSDLIEPSTVSERRTGEPERGSFRFACSLQPIRSVSMHSEIDKIVKAQDDESTSLSCFAVECYAHGTAQKVIFIRRVFDPGGYSGTMLEQF